MQKPGGFLLMDFTKTKEKLSKESQYYMFFVQ